MKIKFASPELANFTGMYGVLEFKDGVSVHDVSAHDIRLFGAITAIEVIGEGFTPEKSYDEIKNISAVSVTLPTLAELQAQSAQLVTALMSPPEGAPVSAPSTLYTKEQLEAIADKEGIAGLRAIGDTLDVRGTSITKLIAAILDAQAKFKPAPEAGFIESPAEAVSMTVTDPLVAEKAE